MNFLEKWYESGQGSGSSNRGWFRSHNKKLAKAGVKFSGHPRYHSKHKREKKAGMGLFGSSRSPVASFRSGKRAF